MYLISVYFDEKTNRILQRHIDKIAEKTCNTFMTENHVPPHMTISAIEARDVTVLVPVFNKLKGQLLKGNIRFVSVGQLLPNEIYATPVINEYLLYISKNVYEIYKDVPETTISRYYRPLSWLPHVTLGKTLDKEQMRSAFEVLQESFSPFEATVTEIGLAKVNPHEDVEKFKLG